MRKVRKLIIEVILIILCFAFFGCKKNVNTYENNHIYTNSFLMEHYYSNNMQYKLLLSEDEEAISIKEYKCLQKYIDILCNYTELEKTTNEVLNEVSKPYAYLESINQDNKKIEVYILSSGKIIINNDDEYYMSTDNAYDFNEFSEVANFSDLFCVGTKDLISWIFSYEYSESYTSVWNLIKENFETKKEYENYRYSKYLIDYLSSIDFKLIKFNGIYDSGERIYEIIPGLLTDYLLENAYNQEFRFQRMAGSYSGYAEDPDMMGMYYTDNAFVIELNLSGTTYHVYYFVSGNFNELFDSLNEIYLHNIDELNSQIDAEWEQMQNNL